MKTAIKGKLKVHDLKYIIDDTGEDIASAFGFADAPIRAEEIVHRFNNYDSLLNALQKAADIMTSYNLMNSMAGAEIEVAIKNATI